MVLLVATASATLGLTLLAASNTPFTHAFGAQRGADVTVIVNAARASSADLAATRSLGGVTAAAGPFSSSTVQAQLGGQPFGQLTLTGRASPGGPVDDVVLNAGHWPDGPGQVVLDTSRGGAPGGGGPVAVARNWVAPSPSPARRRPSPSSVSATRSPAPPTAG